MSLKQRKYTRFFVRVERKVSPHECDSRVCLTHGDSIVVEQSDGGEYVSKIDDLFPRCDNRSDQRERKLYGEFNGFSSLPVARSTILLHRDSVVRETRGS